MGKLAVFPLAIALALGVLSPGAAQVPAPAQAQDGPVALAQAAAEQWLALVDAGKYGESWDEAAQAFKDAVTRKDWEQSVKGARGPLGKVLSRKLAKSDYLKNPPNAPPGEYVGMQFNSSFANLKSASETVVPMLDKDGKWRVSGYYVHVNP
jgi:Protein of unknown function (DUF4019)